MFHSLMMSAAILCGQPGQGSVVSPPAAESAAIPQPNAPWIQPNPAPPWAGATTTAAALLLQPDAAIAPPAEVVEDEPSPVPAEEPAAAAASPDRWFLMRALQGTWYGHLLDSNRLSISGWVETTFTGSSATTGNTPLGGNQPVVWNDQANRFVVPQLWVRLDRAVVTSGTTKPTIGGRLDFLYGTDYRFTMMRGLFNDQLREPGGQRWYGFDLPQFYGNIYFPTVLNGLELRAGRLWCPWGVESIEAISTPFISRSYAFNWAPPFTHFGAMGILTVNPKWQLHMMAVAGNDVWVGDPAQEWRFSGKVVFTPAAKRSTITLAASLGNAVMNTAMPNPTVTVGTPTEPVGRNNLNAVDLVYTRQVTSRLSYNFEGILGWQYAPAGTAGFPDGHAIWGSAANYLFYTLTPRLTATCRIEEFADWQGQRTGFPGSYTATTFGCQFRPRKDVLLRPEVRYDWHDSLTPFDNGTRRGLFTGAVDMIVRF